MTATAASKVLTNCEELLQATRANPNWTDRFANRTHVFECSSGCPARMTCGDAHHHPATDHHCWACGKKMRLLSCPDKCARVSL